MHYLYIHAFNCNVIFSCCHVFTSSLAKDEFWITNCVYIGFYKKMQICHLMFVTCQKAPFPLGNILLWFLIISKPLQTAKHKVSLENQIIFFYNSFPPQS